MRMLRRLALIGCIGLLSLALVAPAAAEDAAPSGAAVLTVVGNIGQANRPPFDTFADPFFAYHERSFAKAYAFDLAMLEALGMHRATIAYEGWPRALEVEGPFLRDVLAAAGAAEGTVATVALDGFATELSPADLTAEDWIVAIKEGGRYLGIGQRGPAWVLYARRDGKTATAEDEARWPWAVFLIEVR
jgi:hypothetical protein